jgi:hypothetical protein
MKPLVIYSYILQHFSILLAFLQKRYSEADFVMKASWKIALYNVCKFLFVKNKLLNKKHLY